jgi:calcium-dependent protein kinase
VSGEVPFSGKNSAEVIENVKIAKYSLRKGIWRTVSSECKDLIEKMLQTDLEKRISAEEAY